MRDLRESGKAGPTVYPGDAQNRQDLLRAHDQYGASGLGFPDKSGLRYQASHPELGNPVARHTPKCSGGVETGFQIIPFPRRPASSSFYGGDAKLGLHQDRDERGFRSPGGFHFVGDTASSAWAARRAAGKTQTLKLASGDVLILEGPSRLASMASTRVIGGSSTLLKDGGRINLTLRRVTRP